MNTAPERLAAALADRYRIERELGAGGMATVYLAEDLKHKRKVALKVLKPELAAVLGVERFVQEITTTAALQHPHILPLFDSGTADGLCFYVMPYVQGETLRARLERERQLPVPDAVRIAREVASALDYAHRHAVIHRDIKPENILLHDGQAIVADFGIALAVSTVADQRMTATGVALGTPAYLSPEQAAGDRNVDGRSDLYSLGCVLYEMLAGQPPFTGATAESVIRLQLVAAPPPLTAVRPALPTAVERAVARAMAKVPADRFATAAQFAQALVYAETASRPTSPAVRDRTRVAARRVDIGLGLTVLVALALVVRPRRGPPLDPDLIVVAPFEIPEPALALWREGLMDILSANLNGAASFRTVSPTVVVRHWEGRADAVSATILANRTGSGLAVTGRLLGTGTDSVRATVTLLDVAAARTLAEIEYRSATTQIDRLADSLTVALLRELGRTRPVGAMRRVSLGARSMPALKAFLQGEQYLRRSDWDSALVNYQRAIELDSSFALALSRMGTVLGWQGFADDSLARAYALRAAAFNHGLPAKDSLLLSADSIFAALYDLEPGSAWWHQGRRLMELLAAATSRYRDDPAVWNAFGEAAFHWGTSLGVTRRQTLEAFDRAIALDSAFAPAYLHTVGLVNALTDTSARQHAEAYLRLHPTDLQAASQGLALQLLEGGGALSPGLDAALNAQPGPVLFETWTAVNYRRDSAEVALRVARALAATTSAPIAPDRVTEYLAWTLAYRGHLAEAYRVAGPTNENVVTQLAMVGALPGDSVPPLLGRWLRHSDGPACLALARANRGGDAAAIAACTRRSDSLARSAPTQAARERARFWAAAGRAFAALVQQDTSGALHLLQALPDSLCPTCYLPRLVTGELLVAQRDTAAARRWLSRDVAGIIGAPAVPLVLWELLRGRLFDQLNEPERAADAYRYVVEAWRGGDPAVQPWVAQARTGLARVTGTWAR